jgi:uncharacterized SAM-binding protein YcdF (DUF218 family)
VTYGSDGVQVWDVRTRRLLATMMMLPPPPVKTKRLLDVLRLRALLGEATGAVEWIVTTPEGYYDGSHGVGRYIRWRVGDRLYPARAFARRFHKPGLVAKALR